MDDQFNRLTEALKAKRLAKMEKEFEKETGLAEMSTDRLLCTYFCFAARSLPLDSFSAIQMLA